MKKEITVGQLLAACIAILVPLATAWVTIVKKVTANEVRMQMIEIQMTDDRIQYRKAIDEVKWQVADGNNKITSILIDLQKKQNKR